MPRFGVSYRSSSECDDAGRLLSDWNETYLITLVELSAAAIALGIYQVES